MISAKLIKDLERKGFELDFSSYSSNKEEIIEILKEKNERLYLALPLLFRNEFEYKEIIKRIDKELIKKFKKMIAIANRIFNLEGIDNKHLQDIIKNNNIKEKINNSEFRYYYDSFKDSIKNLKQTQEHFLDEQIRIRGRLTTNKALSNIFAPGKMKIMDKIFNHEKLTNTELKYYYRSIRPLILSILNIDLQSYIRIIESTKKLRIKVS